MSFWMYQVLEVISFKTLIMTFYLPEALDKMVLTITLNPLLEKRLFFKRIIPGKVNKSLREVYTAGGKGINVSRQLNMLAVKNSAMTFAGGNNGKIFRSLLAAEKIDPLFSSTKSEMRSATLTLNEDKEELTTFMGLNSEITVDEAGEFKHKLDKAIQNSSVIVLSGSSPSENTDDIFPYAISLANKYDKTSILDTYGSCLEKCIEQSPTILHNNISELEDSLKINLADENSKIEIMKHFYEKGIRLCFLTDGSRTGYAAKFNFYYKFTSPAIKEKDSCGSGDSFTAGIAYGIEESLVFEEFLRIAASLGTANAASFKVSEVSFDEMKQYYDQISITPIGKKMKLIDDSPTV